MGDDATPDKPPADLSCKQQNARGEAPDGAVPVRLTFAHPADLPELVELLGQLFAQEADFTPDAEAQECGLRLILDAPEQGTVLVAREAGCVLGMVLLLYTISTALGARVALLEDLIVRPEARGRGIGSRLIAAAVDEARRQGCRRITLLTDADNHRAQALYARHGFGRSAMIPLRRALD